MSLLARVAFYPTLFYNVFMSKVSSRNWYDRIDETMILGALPFQHLSMQLVAEENVKGVVSMNEDYELKLCNTAEQWKKMGVKHIHLATVDLVAAPTQENLVKGVTFIDEIKQNKGSVYIHCKAGRTRSATLVACQIMKEKGCDPKTAVEIIKSKRPHILIRSAQWNALDEFYQNNL